MGSNHIIHPRFFWWCVGVSIFFYPVFLFRSVGVDIIGLAKKELGWPTILLLAVSFVLFVMHLESRYHVRLMVSELTEVRQKGEIVNFVQGQKKLRLKSLGGRSKI